MNNDRNYDNNGRRGRPNNDIDVVITVDDNNDRRSNDCATILEDRIKSYHPDLEVITDTHCDYPDTKCIQITLDTVCDRDFVDQALRDLETMYRRNKRNKRRSKKTRTWPYVN